MCVFMVRSRVKTERVSEVEAAIDRSAEASVLERWKSSDPTGCSDRPEADLEAAGASSDTREMNGMKRFPHRTTERPSKA
jgi:hypothetical protein